jgi:4-diphosphocytidyl-2-C-methyl-D-erythritol kinase
MTLRAACPAKINTFLAVGPPDARAWHPLRTVFQAVSLCDELEIEPAERESLEVIGMELPAENTVTKALRLARELYDFPALRMRLIKRIPAQSGLGGGSSDAAGLLRLLGRLATEHLDEADVRLIAQAVGADAPYFLVGGRAYAEGYGEKLTPEPDLPEAAIALAMPAEACSTAEAYQRLDAMPREFLERPAEPWTAHNDFERIAPCASLDLIERMQVHGAFAAGLSGSGSAVWGAFSEAARAQSAAERLREEGAEWSWSGRTLRRDECL